MKIVCWKSKTQQIYLFTIIVDKLCRNKRFITLLTQSSAFTVPFFINLKYTCTITNQHQYLKKLMLSLFQRYFSAVLLHQNYTKIYLNTVTCNTPVLLWIKNEQFDIQTLCLKKVPAFIPCVTSSNRNRFSNCLHCWKAYEICYKTHTILPTSPQVCCYTALGN